MFNLEFRAALATSTVPPYHVEEVVAGWHRQDEDSVWSGFVVRLREGYAYITSHRNARRTYTSGSTQMFKDEPKHLYARASIWEFDKEKLNGDTQRAKQEAKYPPANSISGNADPNSMGRFDPRLPGVGRNVLHGPNSGGSSL